MKADSGFKEWNALYTTQLTQKAKKYHDGILRLVQIGSHARQVRNWFHYFICILIITTLIEQILTKIDIILMKLLMLYWCPTVVSEYAVAC